MPNIFAGGRIILVNVAMGVRKNPHFARIRLSSTKQCSCFFGVIIETLPGTILSGVLELLFPAKRDGEILPAVLADLVGYLSVIVCMGFSVSHITGFGATFLSPFCF